ncbi:GYD domain-containing protein [Thermodesulfobacteriota bacterium]
MATYITMISYTEQGIQNMKESPARLEQAKEAVKAAGGELKTFYLTMGQYDAIVISEAPSDEVYMTIILALASRGAIRTETLRAFTEDEYRKIISAIP